MLEAYLNGTFLTNGIGGAVTADCLNIYEDEFQKSLQKVLENLNAKIRAGQLCYGTPNVMFYTGEIMMVGDDNQV